MKKTLNHLIQLQELCFARSEQEISNPKNHLSKLEESIRLLIDELPPDVASLFQSIEKRSPPVVVPATRGICSACSISLPTSLYQDIRAGKEIYQCPNCLRILYPHEEIPRHMGTLLKRTGLPKPGISRFSSSALMLPAIEATDREGAISELVSLMSKHGFVENSILLTEAALEREVIASTAVKKGLAFPHVRGVEGGGLTLALGLKKKGLDFSAPDGHLTRIVFFIVIPTAASAFYLKLLSGLIQTFREVQSRRTLLSCKTAEETWRTLKNLTRETIP